MLLDAVLLLAPQQLLHVLLVLLPLEVDLVVELMLKGALLFHEDLAVYLVLLQTNLTLYDADHLVHVLVLAHPLAVYLLALLEDLLELGLIRVLDGVFVVFGPIRQVALLALSRKRLGLGPL